MAAQPDWIQTGRQAFKQLGQIADGYTNLFRAGLDVLPLAERQAYEARYALCMGCAVRVNNTCSKKRSIQHLVTGDWISGCGCNLSASTKSPSYECPAGKWGSIEQLLADLNKTQS